MSTDCIDDFCSQMTRASLLNKSATCSHHRMEGADEYSQTSGSNPREVGIVQMSPTRPIPRVDEQSLEPMSFAGLLPLPVLLSTIDVYFLYCHNQPYSFFHEANFRRRLSDGLIPDHLLFAILATAVRFSTHPFFAGKTHEAAVTYANKSWRSIVGSCFARNEVADVMTVQTITLLAIFDFTGEP